MENELVENLFDENRELKAQVKQCQASIENLKESLKKYDMVFKIIGEETRITDDNWGFGIFIRDKYWKEYKEMIGV